MKVFSSILATSAAESLSGAYEGSVPFIIDVNADFKGDGTADFDLNIKIASKRFNCPGEAITETDSSVTFAEIETTGDCLGDGIRTDGKDTTKYTIDKNSDGTLTFNSDGYPALKMKSKSLSSGSTCSLFEIADGSCGQSDLDCDYTKYAKAAESALQDGTCADQGYTVKTGTQTKSYPIIGDIVITTYSQAAVKSAQKKHYAKGFVRMPRNSNAAVAVAEITDEMRAATPDSLDWSSQGATTAVKDQGQCGSCWAYSATEGIESGLFMASGVLEDLSEQQIISCDRTDGGCNGGDLPTAFEYVMNAGGIDSRSDYPDTSATSTRTGHCQSFQKKVKVTGYKYAVPPCDSGACANQQESDLMAALNTYGPLSVCVNAETWNDYESGIYTATCSGAASMLDHCVQLVGYDKVANYWKVRNSWAADWGEDGFIRLPMGKNACGIADEATYVTAEVISSAVEI